MGKRKYSIFFAIFISSILILSVLGYSIKGAENKIKYNGIKFTKNEQNLWVARINNKPIYLLNNPNNLKNITEINIDISKFNSLDKLYMSLDPSEPIANLLAGFNANILPLLTKPIKPACFVDIDPCKNLPLKDCSNADVNTGIILIKKSNINKIELNTNCLVIQGDSEELKKLIDKWVLELYINE